MPSFKPLGSKWKWHINRGSDTSCSLKPQNTLALMLLFGKCALCFCLKLCGYHNSAHLKHSRRVHRQQNAQWHDMLTSRKWFGEREVSPQEWNLSTGQWIMPLLLLLGEVQLKRISASELLPHLFATRSEPTTHGKLSSRLPHLQCWLCMFMKYRVLCQR